MEPSRKERQQEPKTWIQVWVAWAPVRRHRDGHAAKIQGSLPYLKQQENGAEQKGAPAGAQDLDPGLGGLGSTPWCVDSVNVPVRILP